MGADVDGFGILSDHRTNRRYRQRLETVHLPSNKFQKSNTRSRETHKVVKTLTIDIRNFSMLSSDRPNVLNDSTKEEKVRMMFFGWRGREGPDLRIHRCSTAERREIDKVGG